jgi:hypothetical protein
MWRCGVEEARKVEVGSMMRIGAGRGQDVRGKAYI